MVRPGRLALIVGTALGGPFAVFGSVACGPHTAAPAHDSAAIEPALLAAPPAAQSAGAQSHDQDLPFA